MYRQKEQQGDKMPMKPKINWLITLLFILLSACQASATHKGEKKVKKPDGLYANIETNKGTIIIKLYIHESPLTTLNFIGLATGSLKNSKGKQPFYDNTVFHRVIPNFVIQGGDPTGTGTGGPGYQFSDEINPQLKHDREGILSMANAGPNTNGSQFFITLEATPWLDGKHAIFGEVYEGMDVVKNISQGDTIHHITIDKIGEEANSFVISQEHFDILKNKAEETHKQKATQMLEEQRKQSIAKFSKTPSESKEGILYEIIKEGKGNTPKSGQTLEVHYEGKLLNGEKFDSSYDRGQTFKFVLDKDRLIAGWENALKEMKIGEKRHMVIPAHLAYGSNGIAGVIPPNSFLEFTVELISAQ